LTKKTLKDATDLKERREVSPMPQFTLQWSTRQYGLNFLAHQCCWDLVNSARAHQFKVLEIEVFRKFLDGDYTTAHLTFFLRVRANCLRRGITITSRVKDSDEAYSEVILTSSTATNLIRKLFEKTGQNFINMMIRKLRDEFVKKSLPTVDPSVSYVSVIVLCHQCVETFAKYELLELRKMLQFVQLRPKVDSKQFGRLQKCSFLSKFSDHFTSPNPFKLRPLSF
jgi:hypothetical protein